MSTFEEAFAFTMKYEVGPWFNPNDPETIAGLISTREQRRKVGYVNDPLDRGGETKYGVAKKANASLNITELTLEQAKTVYFNNYWRASRAGDIPGKWAIAHFDAATNHGVKRANILLQRAVGAKDDGIFGMGTLGKVLSAIDTLTPAELLAPRRAFFNAIVANDPTQKRFAKGWLARVDALEKELS